MKLHSFNGEFLNTIAGQQFLTAISQRYHAFNAQFPEQSKKSPQRPFNR